MEAIFLFIPIILLILLYLILSTKIVPAEKYMMVYLRVGLFRPPEESFIATSLLESGWNARVWNNGLCHIPFINTWLFKKEIVPLIRVSADYFRIVKAEDGNQPRLARVVAWRVVGCANFTDGVAFLRQGGERGIQIPVVLPGAWAINTHLFSVGDPEPMTIIGTRTEMVPDRKGGQREIQVPDFGI